MTSQVVRVRVDRVPRRWTPPAKGRGRTVMTPITDLWNSTELLRDESTSGLTPTTTWGIVVRAEDAEGRTGVGTTGWGHIAAVPLIEHLAPFVIGRMPTDLELTWETMYRATINFGRRGIVLHAISALDIALWDLLGKQLGQPVYNLLGGRVRKSMPAYASRLYGTENLDALAIEASAYVADGFRAVKQRMPYGPRDGLTGIRKNIELLETVAEAVGPEVDQMVDAYMGWDLPYAVRFLRAVEDAGIRLRWIEEPLIPDDIAGMAELRRRVSTPIASGEHEGTRWGYRELIVSEAVDILQPDVNRMGGITEARRVWALGETFGREVIAHVGAAHNMHLSISSLATPWLEYIPPPKAEGTADEDQLFWDLFPEEPRAVDGEVTPNDVPGLGITVNEDLLESASVIDADGVTRSEEW